jgi:hypothetical protein
MKLKVGPFDPALHIRSRDHYEAVRREAQLLALQPDTPPKRMEALVQRLTEQFPPSGIEEVVDRAYLAGKPTFTTTVEVPDELVPAALAACDELEALLADLDRWTEDSQVNLIPPSPEIRAYRAAYLAQAREQLQAFTASG